ncbi:MAG: tetratricopeptide repeat protein [Thermoplasmata archaeon]
MRECPLCGNEIIRGKCTKCGYEPKEKTYGDGRDKDMEVKSERKQYSQERRNKKLTQSLVTLESALLYERNVQDAFSLLSANLTILSLPLKLQPNQEIELSEKEKKVIEMSDRIIQQYRSNGGNGYERPEIYIRLGNAHFFCGEYKKALEYYDMALRGYPRHKIATYNKSLAFFSLKNYEKSIKGLRKVLKINPDDKEAKYLLELVEQIAG